MRRFRGKPEILSRDTEKWLPAAGYEARYECSNKGRVRKLLPDGRTLILTPYVHRTGASGNTRAMVVRLIDSNGKRRQVSLKMLVAETWLGPSEGRVPYPKNGMFRECAAWNLAWATRSELGTMCAPRANARGVRQIDRDGHVVAYYKSARAAAKACYISHQSVERRCNGIVKHPFDLMGTSFDWDDEPRMKRRMSNARNTNDRREEG